ncbi:MAG TPA: preprotein translocase subunit SecE [Steroidobacteraceae bacterium]|jgi:preprotein translocase subunit SecE|nr:preprotein translocase subunit SecE [Steroidobacteraceae bacterium]
MTDEIKVQDAGAADKAKLYAAIVIALAGVVGYYLLANQPNWIRWIAVVAGLVLGAVVAGFSAYGAAFREFVVLARVELRKIVWPNRQETGMTTLVVFGFVIVFGLFFWLLDLVLAWATKALTGQGG